LIYIELAGTLYKSAIFAIIGLLFGVISGVIFSILKSNKRKFITTFTISIGFTIIFMCAIGYFIYFLTPSASVRIKNTIIPLDKFSNHYFFSTYKMLKGTTFDFMGDLESFNSKINQYSTRSEEFFFPFGNFCMDIFIIPKTDYTAENDLREKKSQKIISDMCHQAFEKPYKSILKIEHIYKINIGSTAEHPSEIKIFKTPLYWILASLCLIIICMNSYFIHKLSKK
jgi:hypothetical protein